MRHKPQFEYSLSAGGAIRRIVAANDAEAIEQAHGEAGTRGFELRQGNRLVHTEPAKWSGSRLGESHVAYLDFAASVERRRQEGQRLSPVYRIYLRDEAGTVLSGHTIATEDDATAIKVAAVLRDAAKDVGDKFELWRGETLLHVGGRKSRLPTREELSESTQQIVVDTEIVLRDSRRALTESRHLLDAIDKWQRRRVQ